ncbi:MAG: hypothetical protein HS111_07150 [Kofleriaceae bacterium]|nr:hypothetical protein [Kofleriaceae bacterium]MCL4225923.1 hypothetical protein [Myxococcales bacterium]
MFAGHRLLAPVLALVLALPLVACGPSVTGDDDDTPDARTDAAATDGPTTDGDEVLPSRVYAHSGTMLYRIETSTMAAVPIGAFTNLGTQTMTDIAVDRNERMVGVTLDRIFEIDVATGSSTFLADFTGSDNLTSLSFVPVNIADPDGPEMLVAATDSGNVLRIDVSGQTATATVIGDYGQHQGMDIISSGDIVYVKDFGIVATVDVGNGNDFLATINPATWAASVIGTGTAYDKIFGVAFWAGTIYGFVDGGPGAGSIIRLDRQTGAATLVASGSIRWYGAGVTTVAPTID